MKLTIKHHITFIILSLILVSCATMAPPQGGPRDTDPPVVVEADPPNQSVNFNPQQVKIKFNEFVKLTDIQNQVLISPPVKDKPLFQLRGKTLIFDIPDSLKEKTTYNIFFGSSIEDITEGNSMSNYTYTFSTGPYLDSLFIAGNAHEALTHQTEAGWIIMLYKNYSDSVPLKKPPFYITKTNEYGNFRFENLAHGKYKLFGLKDQNKNYIYDQSDEIIAFSDSLIEPFQPVKISDSILNDSLLLDSINLDSLRFTKAPEHLHLTFFDEIDTVQDVSDIKTLNPYILEISFDYPVKQLKLNIRERSDYLQFHNSTKDTIRLFFDNPIEDSLRMFVYDKYYAWGDTLWVDPPEKKKPTITSNISDGSLDFYQKITIASNIPIDSINPDSICFTEKQDSLRDTINISFYYEDSLRKTKLKVDADLNPDEKYNLTAYPGALFLRDGFKNDTLNWSFGINSKENFGNIIFLLENQDSSMNYIIQLTNAKAEILKQKYLRSGNEVKFNHLNPSLYKIRVVEDRNHNMVWDTGIYLRGIQPERSRFFHKEFNVRANWDIRETMDIKTFTEH